MSDPLLTARQDDQLAQYAELVRASPHNLVSRRAREELRSRHIPEAVALSAMLPAGRLRLLDVGSGGGLPGMVIAVARPELEVHLLEATQKKAAFLREAASQLGVDVQVHHGRAEELARGALAGGFDLVTARAVAPLAQLLDYTIPFLGADGVCYAVKGEQWARELEDAAPALRRTGATVLATPDDAPPPDPDRDPDVAPRVVMLGRTR